MVSHFLSLFRPRILFQYRRERKAHDRGLAQHYNILLNR